ncbi:Fanconi anemia group D2 protein-like [Haliotis rufescens]|uniref:Fanconi anemia group D2 protein-like n=1 Tax=Haliotis rufescens TaxID=6454 RepID=UPI00201EE21E|nr:Fanconi anemia group D2 protein-like [Haliotis rufescens]XP_048257398.1 Fanconi anemia group D2 protein-like [Haliotis rufescens]
MQKGKRKNSDSSAQSSKKKKSTDVYTEKSVFTELIVNAGFVLKDGHSNNELTVDQAVFQRDLMLSVKRHNDYPAVVEDFLEGFETYIEDTHRLSKSVMATHTAQECDSARYPVQDSMVKILLGIDILQSKVMKLLLEKLPLFMGDEDFVFENGEKIFIPRVLLSQFRWLDRIVNCKELTTKMLEMIDISSPDVQREIILCLPEVVEDTEHGDVAKALSDILLQGNQMTVPILDALSNLALKPELLAEVRGSVLQTLSSVEMDDLPVVVKFLLQTVTPQDSLEIVTEIRASIDFKPLPATPSKSSKKDKMKKRTASDGSVEKGNEALTLDAIKSGIRFQKTVSEAWIKAIDNLKDPADHKVIDIFVLLILHATNRKKPVESLFRNKIRSGAFTEPLLQSAFTDHAQILRGYFPSVQSLAEVLLRSPEPGICYFASAMYRHAFAVFDSYCKQEIVGNLVTHIGSGFAGEIDSSLDILSDLVHHHLSSMAPFAIFVKGFLDYFDNRSMTQIRKLYAMLSRLAFHNPDDGGLIQDDLHIIIRKQLYNSSLKYKRMGVIGAIMVVKSIAYVRSDQSESTISDDKLKEVVHLLQLVRTSSTGSPEATCLFLDELSSVISKGNVDPKVVHWISENMIADFQDDFVVDVEESFIQQDHMVPLQDMYNLNEDTDSSIAINLLPLVVANHKKKANTKESAREPNPTCLSPHFRLVHICEKVQNGGDLEGIDALLGCPVYTVKEEVYEKYESLSHKEKDVICTTLFHSLNWFRELANCFATQTSPEMKGKVIMRLQNITEVQNTLERLLAVTPGFRPPVANFDLEETQQVEPSSSRGADGKKKGRKPGKKKQSEKENISADLDENSRDSTQSETQKPSQSGGTQLKEGDKEEKMVSLSTYTQYFRELDVSVFTILSTGLITKAALDSEMNTKATEDLQIQPPQLEFLLKDLTRKLDHSLLASAAKRRTFLKTKADKSVGFSHLDQYTATEIATNMIHLLPPLCEHLEGTSAFFQTLISENDGMLDGPGSNSPEAMLMGSCFKLLLQALLSLFSWNGFVMAENRQLLKDGLNILVSRIKTSSSSSQSSFHDLVRGAFNYCQNFAATVSNLPAAVTLLRLLMALVEKTALPELSGKVAELAEEFLKREWFSSDGQREKGAKHNEQLQIVIKMFLVYSADPLEAIEELTKGTRELIEADKNGRSNSYPSLTRHSFSVYYRVLFSELIEVIKRLPAGKLSESRDLKVERLLQWNSAVRILHIFVNLIKTFDGRSNMGTALKYGRMFLEVFLRQGMPLLDCMFKTNREDVQNLLKSFQMSTRALHHVSSHSKIIRDVSLTNQVPMLKRGLEAFVYRVKAMLTLNKCLEAFWMGNLKNRDLQGEEILSQVSTVTNDSEEEDGDAVPVDEDEESDVEMDNQSEAGGDSKDGEGSDSEGSYSEVF